jgi:hypothetical protein
MEGTKINRVQLNARVTPDLKRRFRKEWRKRKVKPSRLMEHALGLLFQEFDMAEQNAGPR